MCCLIVNACSVRCHSFRAARFLYLSAVGIALFVVGCWLFVVHCVMIMFVCGVLFDVCAFAACL